MSRLQLWRMLMFMTSIGAFQLIVRLWVAQ